jgi:hypothetical protein
MTLQAKTPASTPSTAGSIEEVAMQITRVLTVLAAALLPCMAAWADGAGLTADADHLPWARFQGRVSFAGTAAAGWQADYAGSDNTGGLKLNAVSVMGDLYFGAAPGGKGQAGGFRATSGLVSGARGTLWGTPATAPTSGLFSVDRRLFGQAPGVLPSASDPGDNATVPYLGVGYSSLATRGGGWSFSADLGLVSLTPGAAVRLGRVFGGGQNLDDVIRDMRLSPVLQLGASYSF